MRFWKMNGAGNDFIILNNLEERLDADAFPRLARTLCERHLSVGADGLMIVDAPTADADFRMLFYNSDGSPGEMCGNGARCICRYGYETGLAGERQTIETTAGRVTGQRVDKRHYRIRLNDPSVMDLERVVTLDAEALERVTESNGRGLERGVTFDAEALERVIASRGREWKCAYVELGNPGLPHAVVEFPGLRDADEYALRELGRAFRWHTSFPKGANVNFYELTGPDMFYERTFERGVEDFTYACGTGTASTAAVLTLRGLASGKNIRAEMTGGALFMDVERDGNRVTGLYLTGPTNIVATGEIRDETLFP